jgi:hypothetical protein
MLSENMSFSIRWQELKSEDQIRMFRIYSESHFPIEIRFAFADWIDSKPWLKLDINNSTDRQSAINLISGLINGIESKAEVDPRFVAISQQIVEKYKFNIESMLNLFNCVKQCLIAESKIFHNSYSNVRHIYLF